LARLSIPHSPPKRVAHAASRFLFAEQRAVISRREMRPSLAQSLPSLSRRAQGAPDAGRTRSLVCKEISTRVRNHRHRRTCRRSLRNGFRLMCVLPGVRAFLATVAGGTSVSDPQGRHRASANLIPASGQRRGIRTTRLRRPL